MSMSNDQEKKPLVFVRKRKTTETKELVANVVRSSIQQVQGRNIDYVSSQLDFAKDLGETAQRLAHTSDWKGIFDAEPNAKMIRLENNNSMSFGDCFAQRENKGISICEKSLNSRSEEMAKFLGTSNKHSSGQNLWFQNMNLVNPNCFLSNSMEGISAQPSHKPRTRAHQSKIIGPSRFNPNYDQNMQRTSVSAPHNFSSMKSLMVNESSTTLNNEELLYAKELLSTDQGLSSEGQRAKPWPFRKVGNDLFESSSKGQRVKPWPFSKVGNDLFDNSLQQDCQNQVSPQPQEISFRELLERDDISYMDLLTREDLLIS